MGGPRTVDVPVYLQLDPSWRGWAPNHDDPEHVVGASAVRMTKKSPGRPMPGTVVVKVTIRVPKSAFVALQPEAVIEIPEDLTRAVTIEVLAHDANDGGEE